MPITRSRVTRKLIHTPAIGDSVKKLHDRWLSLYIPLSYNAKNKKAGRAFQNKPPTLSDAQQKVLDELQKTGFATARIEDLLPDQSIRLALEEKINSWVDSPEHQKAIADYHSQETDSRNRKPYEIKLIKHNSRLSYNDPIVQFGIQEELLSIVNAYHGIFARFIHADAWHTMPVSPDFQPTASQRWHRDPEDFKILKIFYLLYDLDKNSGPTHYVKYSRKGEKYGHLAQQNTPYGNYPEDGLIEKTVASEDIAVASYPKGQLMFMDTSGLHCGGLCRGNERLVATWAYTSQASWFDKPFQLNTETCNRDLSLEEQFAFGISSS